MAVLVVAALGSPLLSTETVLSAGTGDLTQQFLYSRAFGFGELQKGHLPLWNPYIYGGVPFLGDFQAALFYPPNLIFLILPLGLAINWSFGLHLFILGVGMYLWAVLKGLRPIAAFVAGVAGMFSGTVLLHIFAGHLSNVCSVAWVPFLFVGIDMWLARRQWQWLLVSAGAVALQVYAGHPQYFYYTALVAGLYSLLHLPGAPRLLPAALGLIAIYPAGMLLSAAQLIPGLAATSEAVRSGGVAYEFSAMFSFPPENLLTLFAPWVFGDMRAVPYWGRCYLWEMCFFAGAGTFVLACFGSMRKPDSGRRWPLLVTLLCVVILALGTHTPLHKLLYHVLPGFSSFRGSSKFIVFAGLFIAMLAGFGMDRLRRKEKFPIVLAGAVILVGAILAGAAWTVSSESLRQGFDFVLRSKESYLNPEAFQNADFLRHALDTARNSLWIAAASLIVFAGICLVVNTWKPGIWFVAVAVAGELLIFARSTVVTFSLSDFTYAPLAEFFQKNPGDYRTLNLLNADSSMLLRRENIWGYDPGVLKRYAQLLFVSQGLDPAQAGQYLPFQSPHPILSMLRCQFVISPKADGQVNLQKLGDSFPRFYLVSKYKVIPDATARLAELKSAWFDFKEQVILEEEPSPAPDGSTPRGEIRVGNSTTDSWDVDVTTDRPSILVMTDAYSRDWRVTALPGSTQTTYKLLPANHAVRAIPLAAGTHRLRIEYSPSGFGLGITLTVISLLAAGGALYYFRRREAEIAKPAKKS